MVTGVCTPQDGCGADFPDGGVAQVFNWGFESFSQSASEAPKSICIKIWARVRGDGNPTGTLTIPCLPLDKESTAAAAARTLLDAPRPAVQAPTSTPATVWNSFSSAFTSVCSRKKIGTCRTNAHVVFTVDASRLVPAAKSGSLATLIGGLEISWEGRNGTWSSARTFTYYEQHTDVVSGHGRASAGTLLFIWRVRRHAGRVGARSCDTRVRMSYGGTTQGKPGTTSAGSWMQAWQADFDEVGPQDTVYRGGSDSQALSMLRDSARLAMQPLACSVARCLWHHSQWPSSS